MVEVVDTKHFLKLKQKLRKCQCLGHNIDIYLLFNVTLESPNPCVLPSHQPLKAALIPTIKKQNKLNYGRYNSSFPNSPLSLH
jgi:hypothetical protein